jgi:MFS family permease
MPDDAAATAPAPRDREPSGFKQVIAEQFSLQATIGGPRGLAESILPMTVFSIVWAFTHDVPRSVLAALVPSVILTIWRIVAREPLTQALSGVLGIALGAGIALYTGRAQDFFLPGILKNVGLAAVYAITALVRWPLIGVLLGFTLGEDLNWRRVRPRMRVYQQATWLWAGVFALRAAVQAWLYATGQATALGFVNVVLGLPLFGLAVGLTWLLVRRVPVAKPESGPEGQPDEEPAQDEPVRAEAARD